jgi:GNAT superfamily N-acetyltransferase
MPDYPPCERNREGRVRKETHFRLETYDLGLADIHGVDLDKLHALSVGVGWPHRRDDWQALRRTGHGFAALDRIGRIVGSAMWFPYGQDYATVGMVITSPRLQAFGAGRWLMDAVMAATGSRDLGLNATRAARRLYRDLGFSIERTVYQRQGEVSEEFRNPGPAKGLLREIEPGDLPGLSALDLLAFPADRVALLKYLLEISVGTALARDGHVVAFSLFRPFGRGYVIGPVIADNDADAIAVIAPYVASHAGCFLRIDTRQKEGAFADFLGRCGLPVYDTVTTMSRGRPYAPLESAPQSGRPIVYGLVSQTLG